MKEVHWTLSINVKEDHKKIEALSKYGRLLHVTTILGRPVCWEYEMDAFDRNREPVKITAFIGTGVK